jgi:hypothetical protein
MRSPRREVFFVGPIAPNTDNYLPKQSRKYLLPVIGIQVYVRNEILSDTTGNVLTQLIADNNTLRDYFITFRDKDNRILLQDMPAWSFGAGQQFMKPPNPVAHGQKRFADLPIDPQKSSVKSAGGKATLCIEFIYAESKR